MAVEPFSIERSEVIKCSDNIRVHHFRLVKLMIFLISKKNRVNLIVNMIQYLLLIKISC